MSCAFWLSLNSSRVWLSALGNRVARVLSTAARVWAVFAPFGEVDEDERVALHVEVARQAVVGHDDPAAEQREVARVEQALDLVRDLFARRRRQHELVADLLALADAAVGVDHHAVVAELAEGRRGAFLPVRLVQRGGGAGVDADDRRRAGVALDLRRREAHGGDVVDARHLADGGRRLLGDRCEPVLVDDDEVAGGERPVDGAVDRAAKTGGEDRHERDERDADHERRGGHRGAAGIAQRVLAGEPPGDPEDRLQRPPDERRERAHEERAEHRDRQEDDERPEAHERRPRSRRRRCRTARRAAARRPGRRAARRSIVRTRPPPSLLDEPLAQRDDRRDPRGAQRGRQARDDGHDGADEQRDDDRPRLDDRPGVGQVGAHGLEQGLQALGDEQAARATRPRAAPKPITSASRTIERSTCRRLAPSVRSSASSRVRCATVIENVL